MTDVSTIDSEIRARYSAVRASVPDGEKIALLHIGTEQTGIVVGDGPDPNAMLILAIGSNKTVRDHFKHTPPNSLDLENTILNVEDEVTRARSLIPEGSTLYTSDAAVREIAGLAHVGSSFEMMLSLDAVERTFDRLVSVALGMPAAHEGLPATPEFAATLLILREFMHHMQLSTITVKAWHTVGRKRAKLKVPCAGIPKTRRKPPANLCRPNRVRTVVVRKFEQRPLEAVAFRFVRCRPRAAD